MWCIPPQEDARFVSAMEDVLEVYERPFDELRPLVCLDEAAKQILGEVREPLLMKPASVERYDNEYERRGTCALFMLFEPLSGQREVLLWTMPMWCVICAMKFIRKQKRLCWCMPFGRG